MQLSRMKLFVPLVALAVVVGLVPAIQSECAYADDGAKEISKVSIALSAPVEGTVVKAVDLQQCKVTNGPKASTKTKGVKAGTSFWALVPDNKDGFSVFLGSIEAKKKYVACVQLEVEDGYDVAEIPGVSATVDGKKAKVLDSWVGPLVEGQPADEGRLAISAMIEVTAVAKKAPAPKPMLLPKLVAGKNKLTAKWNKVDGASKYLVTFYECGSNEPLKKATVGKGKKSRTFKGLEVDHPYKVRVVAVNAAGETIAKGRVVHGVVKNSETLGNPKSVKVNKKSVTLAVGTTVKIKAKAVKPKGDKKLLKKTHGAKVRYISSNKKIATVDSKGKIMAKAAGTCTIYAVAINGAVAPVKVTVPEKKVTMRTVEYHWWWYEEEGEKVATPVVQIVPSGTTIALPSTFLGYRAEDISGWADISTEKEYKTGDKVKVTKDMKFMLMQAILPS